MLSGIAETDGMARAMPRLAVPEDANARLDLAPFAEFEALVVAVSGGPDSMALLLLIGDWLRHLPTKGPTIHVATVDHRLRAESSSEADLVAAVAASLGFSHRVLPWLGEKPTSRIQERARAARYALLADHARAQGARHILTAHHADDQAETILLRLGRGSGVAGLAGMREATLLAPDLWLARPLLRRSKADLVAICREAACPFVDDPSNGNPRFARAKLRARSSELESLGLGRAALARLGRRMARADAALEAEAARVGSRLDETTQGDARICSLRPLAATLPEIRLRVLGRLIRRSLPAAVVKLERLEDLADPLFAALEMGASYRATIAGTILVLGSDGVLSIHPEGPRRRGRGKG